MTVEANRQGLHIVAPDNDTLLNLELLQGLWTEEQYFKLTDHSRRLLEFTDGSLEVLAMPTDRHQARSALLDGFVAAVTDVFDAS